MRRVGSSLVPAVLVCLSAGVAGCGPGRTSGQVPASTPVEASITITAQANAFSPRALAVPAGTPFRITFDNRDPTVHELVITSPTGAVVVRSDQAPGPQVVALDVPALQPGILVFTCTLVPGMRGQLSAG